MDTLLWLIIIIPFAGSLILALFGAHMAKRSAGILGCVSVGVSWILAMVVATDFLQRGASTPLDSTAFSWIGIGRFQIGFGLHFDALSLVMTSTITFVAFLIHLYASQSMYDEDGYSRFFSYMNLFVGSMLTLVLAANLLLLYLGWEGVGLCSYLLIGFWYRDRNNGYAAQKAFIVTRIGDTAMIIGLFLAYRLFGTLDIQSILTATPTLASSASSSITVIAILLLGGALGKSAQIPLQTWLPDAMAGPTPVSALIHAATMVIAGVYLVARLHTLFTVSPGVQLTIAIIGTVTLVYAGFSALVQRDIKRVLAYSTMSQIGYMFLALGVGAWTAAIFHFVTHAFFKSLLFLSSGIVIDALDEEHDLFKMGGLRRQLPVAYWTFLIGAASLSALPFITAGFYSKDAIVWASLSSSLGSTWLWLGAAIGSLITAAYSFRAVYLAFYGEQRTPVTKRPGILMKLVVIILATFAVLAGFINMPNILGHFDPFARLLSSVLPSTLLSPAHRSESAEIWVLAISSIESLLGIYLAYLYYRKGRWARAVEGSPIARLVHRFLFVGWGFDWLYNAVFVRPFKAMAYGNQSDMVDKPFEGMGALANYGNTVLSRLQTGRLRDYAVGLLVGAIVVAAIVLLR